jgi:uncharacterized protein (TIGR02246 family)
MPPEYATPAAAEAAFYEAFEAADLEAMMAVWADADDIACVHPGSVRLSGRQEVRESWRQIFSGSARLRFRIASLKAVEAPALAVHSVYEQIAIEGQPGAGNPIVATNIYVRTERGWRLWMHHASPLAGPDDDVDDETPTLH